MSLKRKFVVPINLILVGVLAASLAWEWRRQRATGMDLLRARLDEEARFVRAAYHAFGLTPRFDGFLRGFCLASDPGASPEHQVALVDDDGRVIEHAAARARHPLDPARLAALGDGFWWSEAGDDGFLVRVVADGGLRVVVAESTAGVRGRVRANLWSHAAWYLGLGGLLLLTVNGVMRRAVLRPIRKLGRAVTQMERGRLGVRVELPEDDELGGLAGRFNAMSGALAAHAAANRREMETARRVQSHLLPPPVLRLGCLEVAGRVEQAGPVGGDLLDVIPLPGDRVGVLVADLTGHNVAAALHTAMVRAIVRRESEQAATPGEVLARLNEQLVRDLPDERFATAFLAWFDPHAGRLDYANAGHPPAILRQPDGRVIELGPTCPLLGVLPELPAAGASVDLEPGALLLAFSDGLAELRSPDGALRGDVEAVSPLRTAGDEPPARLLELVRERATRLLDGRPPADDLTVAVARYEPSSLDPLHDRSHARPGVPEASHA